MTASQKRAHATTSSPTMPTHQTMLAITPCEAAPPDRATPASHAPDAVADLLARHRFRVGSERELQDGIEQVLGSAGLAFARERALSRPDRPDFLVDGGTAIEVKTKGSLAELLRQVSRYALHDEIRAVLCVGTPAWLARVPDALHGKRLLALRLTASLF